MRNEAGIVTDPDGRSWGRGVYPTRRPYERGAAIDAAIGEVVALAVTSPGAAS